VVEPRYSRRRRRLSLAAAAPLGRSRQRLLLPSTTQPNILCSLVTSLSDAWQEEYGRGGVARAATRSTGAPHWMESELGEGSSERQLCEHRGGKAAVRETGERGD